MDISSSALIATGLIVAAGVIGMVFGFLVGVQYGRVAGELKAIKSIKSRSHRSSRGSGSEGSAGKSPS